MESTTMDYTTNGLPRAIALGLVVALGCGRVGFRRSGEGSPDAQLDASPARDATREAATDASLVSCPPGTADCNMQAADGCEAELDRPQTCGSCNVSCGGDTPLCQVTSNGARCTNRCTSPTSLSCGDTCVDPGTNVNHCGGCDRPCSFDHATARCEEGSCVLAQCDDGWDNCDGRPENGCETSLRTASDCGQCGRSCSLENATAACPRGSCTIEACDLGYGSCDESSSNGCETELGTTSDCASCDDSCILADANTECQSSSCTITSCTGALADCDGDFGTGCETDTTTRSAHCGGCNQPCGMESYCASGECQQCPSGQYDCDGDGSNGCESDLTGIDACGSCDNECTGGQATWQCTDGSCEITACDEGYDDCDGDGSNGCETSLSGSDNCGSCGNECGIGQTCCSDNSCGTVCL